MFRMNLKSAAVAAQVALTHMGQGGAILHVGAAATRSPGVGMAAYAASKAGVHMLTESLADEVRERGIRVNAVLPTILDTPANRAQMPDADRSQWVHPDDAAQVIAFLLGDAAQAVTGASVTLAMGRAQG